MSTLINFRDAAAAADPGAVHARPGVLFRSAQPYDGPSAAPQKTLAENGITTVIDLRGPDECLDGDWGRPEPGVEIVRTPLDTGFEISQRWAGELRDAADLGAFYLDMAQSSPQALAVAVRAAARPGGVLIHCAAGKDRTGLMTALLLSLLGVPDQGVVEDYTRTAEALPAIFARLAERPHAQALNTETMDIPEVILQAPAGAIAEFLRLVAERFGDAEGFLTHCGVEPETLQAFRAKAEAGRG
ncbi:tyrosine-protein phosphatase [Catenulispora sp. NL8]|uniref:Tyrosine-protein phosphatase n=1 Tax=Catenulispora pinistramenti TaxID=2705254 RepID=A0ABS5KZX9_9ACTN|nr:tyrosine-protein phosphatase [Catenulispora pinistramenti]MBS2551569.1 tyrosine-protein phosphatase [Catenulispora pinistramenti]